MKKKKKFETNLATDGAYIQIQRRSARVQQEQNCKNVIYKMRAITDIINHFLSITIESFCFFKFFKLNMQQHFVKFVWLSIICKWLSSSSYMDLPTALESSTNGIQ